MRVEVTEDDIKLGERQSPGCCPIARALNRVTGKNECFVYTDEIVGPKRGYAVPAEVLRFIHLFDTKQEVKPFAFVLSD